jgi:hypothetical protein
MKTSFARVSLLTMFVALGGCGAPERPASPPPTGAESTSGTRNVVRQIDHILIASREAEAVFALLSETFRLPIVWPMSDYGGFASGGVALGNVNIEILRSTASGDATARSRIIGFALEPEPLAGSLAELEARNVPHGSPSPYNVPGPDGSATTLWTTVALPSVSSTDIEVFFCQYEHDVAEARRELLAELQSRGGGPLSALSVAEVVYGTVDADATRRQWQALLDPVQPSSPGLWSVGEGPAIRVVPAPENGLLNIVITVASLSRAREFLAGAGLLGAERPGELSVASPELEGARITLVEGDGA